MKRSIYPRKKKKKIQTENRKLVEKYPFLKSTNSWTGLEIEDYNYNFTLLDDIPEGWKKRFGIALCKDLKEILEKNNCLEEFCILQIKEKFGSLRIYDNGAPKEWNEHLWAWEYISSHTCIKCGDFPVPLRNDGWICPECNSCFHERIAKRYKDYENKIGDIDEYINNITDNFDGRVVEYTVINSYNNDGNKQIWIDLKPFYDKIDFKYNSDNLISKVEIEEILKRKGK